MSNGQSINKLGLNCSLIIGLIVWYIFNFTAAVVTTILCFILAYLFQKKVKELELSGELFDSKASKYWLNIEDFDDINVDIKSDSGFYVYMFAYEIVGESNYQSNLNRLIPPEVKKEIKQKIYYLAELVIENNNEYDMHAIAVEINGKRVGYISRNENKKLKKRLKLIDESKSTFSCMAAIVGGQDKHYGVWLDI